jgi:hypothetical protein
MLTSIKGKIISFESTMNGHTMEIIDVRGRYIRCFICPETIAKSHIKTSSIKPKAEIKIKGSRDIDIYGNEIFNIEQVSIPKKEDKQKKSYISLD